MSLARRLMLRLRDVAEEHGLTVVIVVHEINYAAAHADRIVAMKNGRVAAEGAPSHILTDATLSGSFETPVAVREVDGRTVALHSG